MNPNNSSNSENQVNEAAFMNWVRNNPQLIQNFNQQSHFPHNPVNLSQPSPSSLNLNNFPQNSPNINNAYPYFQNSMFPTPPQQWSQSPSQCNESYPVFSSQIPSWNSNTLDSGFEEDDIEEEDTEVGAETPTSGRNQNVFSFKEDEALISSYMRVSNDSCIGTNQKMTSFWSRVKKLYDEAKAANGTQMKVDRTVNMLIGRWGRITKAVMKFVGCIEAAKRDLGNRTSGMNDEDVFQRARGLYRGKFTFESQWKMLRKFPKWEEIVTEYNAGDRRSLSRQGRRDPPTPTTPSDDSGKRTRLNEAGGFSTPSDDGEGGSIGRPIGRNEAKRKKGKAVVSSSVEVVQEWGDSISTYRDIQLKKLEAAQLKEARKQSQLDLEMRRLLVEEKKAETEQMKVEQDQKNAKFQKKWNMYESLMRRPHLTQQQQELADKLFNEIQDHLD